MAGPPSAPDSDAIRSLIARGEQAARDGRRAEARGMYAQAAKAGSAAGLRCLAIDLLTEEPVEAEPGVNMIRAAAAQGDADAAYVCGMIAAEDEALPDRWAMAKECLEIAASRGHALAAESLAFVARHNPEWRVEAKPPRTMFKSPRVSVIEGFASEAECDWMIARSAPNLGRATVYDVETGTGTQARARSNAAVVFNVARTDIVLLLLRARIAATMGQGDLEIPQVLLYRVGQEFLPHFDFLNPDFPGHARDLARSGQRIATFLVYLNEGYEGGETEFPKLGWRYKGRTGDALLFWNLDAAGEPDRQTFHAGLPPTQGEKWLLSQWLRERQ